MGVLHVKPAAAASNTLAGRLARLGLKTDADFALHLPLRYEDETRITALADARPGVAAQFEVEVTDCDVAYRPRRQLIARVRDAGGALSLRFLNFYPSQQKVLQPGTRVRIFGEVHEGYLGPEIIHPRFHPVAAGESLPDGLTPVYPTTAGLGQATLRRLIEKALARVDLSDTLAPDLLRRLDLPGIAESIRFLHNPPPEMAQSVLEARDFPAWRRVQFDELLAQQLSLRRAYLARRARGAPKLGPTAQFTDALLKSLPFKLTGAQQRAWREIAADLGQPHPMQRLLQGDVGSGKTVVAALAILHAVEAGHQAALMAPTEILAEQHYRKLATWLQPLGLEVAWLTGSLKKRDKEAAIARVGAGDTAIAIGTHALIEDKVEFARLGLAIVDEQHRFGVRQRLALKDKGSFAHQLAMSATPIPRTLAMSYYADLDVSVLDELPPGRSPVTTRLVAEGRRDEVLKRVHDACRTGRQAYWVCPLIEESETLQLKTAEETYARLVAELPDLKIGLVHGRLKAADKAAVMAAFVGNEVHVLVATTVIEVGVDVPNASLMVIEHAERFGLAQLHQLRGRVGRGAAQSACILLYAQPLGELARARLKAIFETNDGFEIAREDLRLRGPGEFIGARQSGMPLLRYADLEDAALVERARVIAEDMLRDAPELATAHLQRWLGGREELLKA
ncbi:ATP-dependent DNA helicase RecG [Sulfuritalea sp.]|uniref:ATP-dependent DNA helicase RecG n=1 Tax=Sulfuritalea sp. TaxID=2480090 RepID=UPI001AC2D88C|nr:ATP-dependent DNA helicase RecG [Sulfuritalea sp.]MBN8476462.1 ATP-dependent DNA helicase RecG [Sulfuritalea sp.]